MRDVLPLPGAVAPQPNAAPAPAKRPNPRRTGWDLLLACAAVFLATSVGRVHQLFPVLMPLKPALVASALAIVLYLLQQTGPRQVGRLRSRTTTYMLGVLVWAALSVPTALNQGVAFSAWTDLARAVTMCLVIAGAVRSIRDVERLILVYFGVTVVYTAVVLSRFELGADNWRLAKLYYYDANDLATLIVSAMPLGLYFVLAHRRVVMRLLAAAGVAMLAVGLIRSGSRGGFLALLAIVAYILLGFTTIPARSRVLGLVVILAVAIGSANDRYWTQMQTIVRPNQDYNLTSDGGRMKIWKRGLGYMVDRPAFGVGVSNFQTAEGTISPLARRQERGIGVRWGAAHNSFIQAGAELGIPGVLLLIGVITSAFVSLRRVARYGRSLNPPSHQLSRLAQSLMTALVGFTVGAFFLSLAYSDMLYTLAAFAIALAKVARTDHAGNQVASL